ncbi:MAG: PEP-CTERM sorting domain-containing protein [Opitutales bacterium]|nr:PEP-CTERM sorting domain-containing protein [Opitutales bacterium]
MNRKNITALTALGAFALASATAQGQILYQASFDNTTGNNVAVGTTNAGAPEAQHWQYGTAGGVDRSGTSIVFSGGAGDGAFGNANGFIYHSTNNDNNQWRSVVYWDDRVSLDQALITELSIAIRHQNSGHHTRFVVQIGSDWFTTAQSWGMITANNANWETKTFDFSTANAWVPLLSSNGTDPFDGLMGAASDGFTPLTAATITTGVQNLPAGNITSIGFLTSGEPNVGGNARTDSLQVIPEPSTYAALIGLLALGLVAWRRRR